MTRPANTDIISRSKVILNIQIQDDKINSGDIRVESVRMQKCDRPYIINFLRENLNRAIYNHIVDIEVIGVNNSFRLEVIVKMIFHNNESYKRIRKVVYPSEFSGKDDICDSVMQGIIGLYLKYKG